MVDNPNDGVPPQWVEALARADEDMAAGRLVSPEEVRRKTLRRFPWLKNTDDERLPVGKLVEPRR